MNVKIIGIAVIGVLLVSSVVLILLPGGAVPTIGIGGKKVIVTGEGTFRAALLFDSWGLQNIDATITDDPTILSLNPLTMSRNTWVEGTLTNSETGKTYTTTHTIGTFDSGLLNTVVDVKAYTLTFRHVEPEESEYTCNVKLYEASETLFGTPIQQATDSINILVSE